MENHESVKYVLKWPTAKDMGLSETVTKEANAAVTRLLTLMEQSTSQKQKAYSVFSDEQRATISQYAAKKR